MLLDLPEDLLVNVLQHAPIGPLELGRLECCCSAMQGSWWTKLAWQFVFLKCHKANALGPPKIGFKAELARRELWVRNWKQKVQATADVPRAGWKSILTHFMRAPTYRQQRVHLVDPSRSMQDGVFPSIAAACSRAQAFDIVLVASGVYKGQLVLDKSIDIVGLAGSVIVTEQDESVINVSRMAVCRVANLDIRQRTSGDADMPRAAAVHVSGGVLVLEESTVSSCAGHGVCIKGQGAYAYIQHNVVQHANGVGILVGDKAGATVEDNDIVCSRLSGVAILSGADPVIRHNKIHDGLDSGVLVSEEGKGRVEQNDIYCNMRAGVAIMDGSRPLVAQNRIHDGHDSGVLVSANGRGSIEENEIYSNKLAGIAIGRGGASQVTRNRIRGGSGVSLLCLSTQLMGRIKGNIIEHDSRKQLHVSQVTLPEVEALNLIQPEVIQSCA